METKNRVPELTAEERRERLLKAVRLRQERAEIRIMVKNGSAAAADVIKMADGGNEAARGMRVRQLVESVPGYGRSRAAALMEQIGISEKRRVGGLGARQRRKLVEALGGTL